MKKIFFSFILFLFLTNFNVLNNHKDITHNHTKITNREKNLNANTTFLSNNATYYFSNLTQNYAKNYQGTCAYVATAMLLQYYDTMWDDNIIPYQFEVESISSTSINYRTSSPGIRTDKIPGLTDNQAMQLTHEEYFDYVMNMTNSYFQPFLFKYAYDNFGSDYITIESPYSFASLSHSGRRRLINDYLQNYVGYSSSDYTLEIVGEDAGASEEDNIREYIIGKIKKGIPVLVGGFNGVTGHACIAYDYDRNTDKIYLHWGSQQDPLTDEIDFEFASAMTLEFHGEHRHTNNYQLVTNGNVTYYCGCHLATHKHVAHTVEAYNEEYHTEICFCGYTKRDYHSCTGTMGRYEPCLECGTIVDLWSVSTNSFIREEELEIA